MTDDSRSGGRASDAAAAPSAAEMKVFKWLKRDRRSSEPQPETMGAEDSPDTIRTAEYKKALSDFFARRSLGGNVSLDERDLRTPQRKPPRRKVQSEKKPKRRSLPVTTDVPQIQFLFSNQIFMPGSNNKDKNDNNGSSLISTSPDLLPPRFLRNIDLDADPNPPSPPDDFFRQNSLPYQDKSPRSFDDSSKAKSLDDSSKVKSFEDASKSTMSPTSSLGSMARKLEQMCQCTGGRDNYHTHFRGIQLLKTTSLDCGPGDSFGEDKWFTAKWKSVPVAVKKNPKSWCSPSDVMSLDHFVAQDLDILTKIRHPNILLLMGICCNRNSYVQSFYEECSCTLNEYIHQQSKALSVQMSLQYLSGIASALTYLKLHSFVHTSISSHTIMLSPRGVAKLCNFELCCRILPPKKRETPCDLSFSSEEAQYENIRETPPLDEDSSIGSECVAQEVTLRSLFAPFRWQAPELFDDCAGLVYPSLKTDVYSLCLVLWECCNSLFLNIIIDESALNYDSLPDSIPWKTISYEQLCDIYFQWKTGIRLPALMYPDVVQDILAEGLSLKPKRRMSIESLTKKLQEAMIKLDADKDIYIHNWKTETSVTQDGYKDFVLPIIKNLQKIDLDVSYESISKNKIDTTYNSSCPRLNNEEEAIYAESDGNNLTLPLEDSPLDGCSLQEEDSLYRTNSTEYYGIQTPATQRFTSHDKISSVNQLKISFQDDSPVDDKKEKSTNENIAKLTSIVTPKSYKSLEIESTPDEKLNSIRSLTKSFELNNSGDKKSSYSFEIRNSSLPMTPIARNTKIRRNAWLSGEEEQNQDAQIKTEKPLSKVLNKTPELKTTPHQKEDGPNVFNKVVDRGRRRHSLMNIKYTELPPYSLINNSGKNDPSDQEVYGRCRSLSWSSKPTPCPKSTEDVTGIDIKPIVAIHEKWIHEAKIKQNPLLVSPVSMPDSRKGPLHAVKPASHLIDPLRPKNGGSLHSYESDNGKKKESPKLCHYTDVSPMIRSSVLKKRIINSNPADFFENSLWQKEKQICLAQTYTNKKNNNHPQGCSTPRLLSCENLADKFTNTDTFDDLCKKIIMENNKYATYTKVKDAKNKQSISTDQDIKMAKSSLLSELSFTLEKNSKCGEGSPAPSDWSNKNDGNVTVTIGPLNKTFTSVTKEEGTTEDHDDEEKISPRLLCRNCKSSECEDDCAASESQYNDPINKALKRCQAFSALQDARSTEDMYIDDELTANMDIQSLGENMKLVPLDGHLHETVCDKGDDCCLIRIQEEAGCQRVLLFCDNSKMEKPAARYDSSDEEEREQAPFLQQHHNLKIESLPSMDLIDFAVQSGTLSVIEERSGEEDNEDSDDVKVIGVRDLIYLYEKDGSIKNAKENKCDILNTKPNMNTPKKEISIFILDDNTDCDKNQICQNDILNVTNLIEDVVHV